MCAPVRPPAPPHHRSSSAGSASIRNASSGAPAISRATVSESFCHPVFGGLLFIFPIMPRRIECRAVHDRRPDRRPDRFFRRGGRHERHGGRRDDPDLPHAALPPRVPHHPQPPPHRPPPAPPPPQPPWPPPPAPP